MGRNYRDFINRNTLRYGKKFDPSNLDNRFLKYYENGERIKVRYWDMEITGTVGVTTGWKPCFLLMRKSNSIGSCWTLESKDIQILAVKKGAKYVTLDRASTVTERG